MINQLLIENFQSWKSCLLIFHKGVNIIIGETDSGKSAIMRMFELIINNKPPKGSYITKGEKNYKGVMEINDCEITRQFKKNTHSYILKNKSGRIKKLDAVGKGDPPEFISKIINISEINMQLQHDDIFMLRLSAGETARFLNRVVDLSDIHETTKNIAKILRDEERDLDSIEIEKDLLEEDLEKLDWINEADDLLKSLEKKEQKRVELERDGFKLQKCLEMIENQQKKVSEASILAELSPHISDLREKFERSCLIEANKNQLDILIRKCIKNKNKTIRAKRILKAKNQVESLHEKLQTYWYEVSNKRELKILLQNINITENEIKVLAGAIKVNQKEFDKAMGSSCILCGRKIG